MHVGARSIAALLAAGAAAVASASTAQPSPSPARTSAALDGRPPLDTKVRDELDAGAVERELQALRRELDEIGGRTKLAEAHDLAIGRAYVRARRAGVLPLAGGLEKLEAHATQVERLRRALERSMGAQRAALRRREQIAVRLAELEEKRRLAENQKLAFGHAQAALLAAHDRQLAFERAFSSSTGPAYAAVYGADPGPGDPIELSAGFEGRKGRLPFPVAGRAEIKAATRSGAEGSGLEMRVAVGTPVRAVYPGRVAFADEYAAYGQTVILDHGGGWYTVSSNLRGILVQAGDDVAQGVPIASVGDTGTGPLLYFEIRRGAEAVPPAEWFGL